MITYDKATKIGHDATVETNSKLKKKKKSAQSAADAKKAGISATRIYQGDLKESGGRFEHEADGRDAVHMEQDVVYKTPSDKKKAEKAAKKAAKKAKKGK